MIKITQQSIEMETVNFMEIQYLYKISLEEKENILILEVEDIKGLIKLYLYRLV